MPVSNPPTSSSIGALTQAQGDNRYGRINTITAPDDGTTDATSAIQSGIIGGAINLLPKPALRYRILDAISISTPGTVILAPTAEIRQETAGKPVFDVLPGADDVEIMAGLLKTTTIRYPGMDDDGTFRGVRSADYSAGVYTCAHRGTFRARVDGFYCGGFASNWNGSALDPEGTRRENNYFKLRTSNVDFGLLFLGQDGLEFDMDGSYVAAPGSPHPSHMVYASSEARRSKNIRGKAFAKDGIGGGKNELVTLSNATGGTFTLTFSGQTTSAIAYNAPKATIQAALGALSNIGSGNVWVYGPNGGPYNVIFASAMGNVAEMTADGSSLTGTSPTAIVTTVGDGGVGEAFQFKSVDGGAITTLQARNCPGTLSIRNSTNLNIDEVVSTEEVNPGGTGSIYFQEATISGVNIGRILLDRILANRCVRMDGSNNHIHDLEIFGNRSSDTADTEVNFATTSAKCSITMRYTNKLTAKSRGVLVQGTDNSVKANRIESTNFPITLNDSTRASVEYDPASCQSTSSSDAVPTIYLTGTNVEPRIRPLYTPKAFSTTGGGAVSVHAGNQTHVVLSINATNTFQINNPTGSYPDALLTYELYNNSGGTLSGITWDSNFVVNTPFSLPLPGERRTVVFRYDGTNWREQGGVPRTLAYKEPTRVCTTTTLPANTATTTTTLTANANGTLPSIDGIALVVGDRVLVRNEATQANNGIYDVTSMGSASTPWVLTRSKDANTSAKMVNGFLVVATEGTTNQRTLWELLPVSGGVVLGTSAITFTAPRLVNAVLVTGVTIGVSGTQLKAHISATTTYDPPSLATGAQQTTTVTVTGAALGDEATCAFSLDLQGTSMRAYVSATNTVTVVHRNDTGGTIDLGSGTLRASVWQH